MQIYSRWERHLLYFISYSKLTTTFLACPPPADFFISTKCRKRSSPGAPDNVIICGCSSTCWWCHCQNRTLEGSKGNGVFFSNNWNTVSPTCIAKTWIFTALFFYCYYSDYTKISSLYEEVTNRYLFNSKMCYKVSRFDNFNADKVGDIQGAPKKSFFLR